MPSNCQWSVVVVVSQLLVVIVRGQLQPSDTYITEQLMSIPDFRKSGGYGEPVILTPLIEAGSIEEARNRSRVSLTGTEIKSFSGYFTVDPRYNANLFFWFFPCLNETADAPLIVWLEGGPGLATMFAVFTGNGPWRLDSKYELHDAQFTWASDFNLLYIDNPIGTGFSYANDRFGFSPNISHVSSNLYNALRQFFIVFDDYLGRDLYVMGVSYAGKYVLGLAYEIYTGNLRNDTARLNLKGMAIENGFVDPESQMDYGNYYYNLGLIDEAQLDVYILKRNEALAAMHRGDHVVAFCHLLSMLNGCSAYFKKYTGLESTYNFLTSGRSADLDYWAVYLSLAEVRRAVHVGNNSLNDGRYVAAYMGSDITKSVKPLLEALLESGYKTLLYNGQTDAVVPYVFTSSMAQALNWTHAGESAAAPRVIWKVEPDDAEIAGYVKRNHNLFRVLVRNAGHMVEYDQPRVALDLIRRFVYDLPFA